VLLKCCKAKLKKPLEFWGLSIEESANGHPRWIFGKALPC
jgi:hypothetical protein